MAYSSFENLEVWRRATDLAVAVIREVEAIPSLALRNQIQRSVVSVPSNIAEGAERDSSGDYIRFLRIAKGSAAELRTQLLISRRLGYLREDFAEKAEDEARQIGAMLQGLIRSIAPGEFRECAEDSRAYITATDPPTH